MKIGKLYDHISQDYREVNDGYQILSKSMETALEQLAQQKSWQHPAALVVDLGVGEGEFLVQLNQLAPQALLFGVDVSNEMLAIAAKKIPLTTITSGIENAVKHLPAGQFDLVACHFVSSTIPLETLCQQASVLLKKNALFSLVTTTKQCLQGSLAAGHAVKNRRNPLIKLAYAYFQRGLKKVRSPVNMEEIKDIAKKNNLKIAEHKSITFNICFNSKKELIHFGLRSGWLLTGINFRFVPTKVILFLAEKALGYLKYPIEDKVVIEIICFTKIT